MKATKNQKFMMTSPLSQQTNMQYGPAIIQNHLIVNINENKNINNFYNVIQGRKVHDEEQVIRMGRNETETNSKDLLAKFKAGIEEPVKSKTMISKKLLNQARQQATKKSNHNTMAALISKQVDSKINKLPLGNNTMKDLNIKATYHTQARQSQDFEQTLGKHKASNTVTLDYQKATPIPSNLHGERRPLGMKMVTERRKSTQPHMGGKSTIGSTVKTSRPLAHAKQTKGFTRHKRFKSEIKNGYKTQQPTQAALRPKSNHGDKSFLGTESVNMTSQFQTKRATNGLKRDEGISLSSGFSSASGRGAAAVQDTSTRELNHNPDDSLAQQLSRTYFLNTKQLLRHLSPQKERQEAEHQAPVQLHKQSLSQCGGKENTNNTLLHELSQRNTTTFRSRSKSTSQNIVNINSANGPVDRRRNHSYSASRTKTANVKTNAKLKVVNQGDNPADVSKSAGNANNSSRLAAGAKQKHKLDKLIKQNIRKNQTKIEESVMKRQLEEIKQQQRRTHLTQRNKELRQMNAHRVASGTQRQKETSIEKKAAESVLTMEVPKDRQRSQSCVDYKSLKGKTMESYRKPTRSQERCPEGDANPDHSNLQASLQRQQPLTTTNQAKSAKQRNFVDEIARLTQQVERELGLSTHHAGRPQSTHLAGPSRVLLRKQPKSFLNDTADSAGAPNDKTNLTSYRNDQRKASTKRSKKKDKMSYKVQKFIERKKREDIIKKSMEQTIEVEKALKIKQNLKNLDKFVQQHLRQKSQPTFPLKKSSIVNSLAAKPKKTQHKKNKKTQDQPIVGLSEIFYPDFGDHSVPDFGHDENAPDMTAQHISHERIVSMQTSLLDYADPNNSAVLTAARSTRPTKKPTSSSKSKQVKRSLQLEKTKDSTTLGVRTASGSGVPMQMRKTSAFGAKRSALQPAKHTSVPLPGEQTNEVAARFNARSQQVGNKKLAAGEKSRWLEQKHPELPDESQRERKFIPQIPTQSDFNQTTKLVLTNLDVNNGAVKDASERKKANKSSGKIRRIHELVSLYRCKFKPNVSDASIIGTLHSAASVIQIHFRYRKHLRETAHPAPSRLPKKQERSSLVKATKKKSARERKSPSTSNQKGQSSEQEAGSRRVIQENLSLPHDYQDILADQTASAFKEVRASIFTDEEAAEAPKAPSERQAAEEQPVVSPKELKFKRDRVQLKQQTSLDKMSSKAARDPRKPNKLQLMLDVEQITNEGEQNTQTSGDARDQFLGGVGNKTPQIPGLDLNKLHKKEKKGFDFRPADIQTKSQDDPYAANFTAAKQPFNDVESQASQQTVSSYRGLFNRVGLPLPRSARVKVDYDLVQKDPKITEQLKEIIEFKEKKGKQVLNEGRKEQLISERTFHLNLKRLERWVSSSHRKIQELNTNVVTLPSNRPKLKVQTNDQLLAESVDCRERLQKLMTHNMEAESSRQPSHMSQSWRAPIRPESASGRNSQMVSERPRLQTSGTHSSGPQAAVVPKAPDAAEYQHTQNDQDDEDDLPLKLDDIQIHDLDLYQPNRTPLDYLPDKDDSQQALIQTEKSLNRSISHPTIQNKDMTMRDSEDGDMSRPGMKSVDPSDIVLQLEDDLQTQKRKQDSVAKSASKDERTSKGNNLEDLRDPRFFMSKVDDESVEDQTAQQPVITYPPSAHRRASNPSSCPESERLSENQPAPSLEEVSQSDKKQNRRMMFERQPEPSAIRVENQQPESASTPAPEPSEEPRRTTILTHPVSSGEPAPMISSPVSDGQSFEFCKIQTGAQSLSSTDSDMAKAIRAANRDILESPPNLISPKNDLDHLVSNKLQVRHSPEHMQFADELSDLILSHLLREIKEEIPILVQRPQLVVGQRPTIKFFDKKGIKTDLFAIEKYVDEIHEEVKQNREQFMAEVNRPQTKEPMDCLFHMQNSEIGSYEHFQPQNQSVLSLDLYLKLEKRRKESFRPNSADGGNGGFDFENVSEQELRAEGVNKNFLAECQHIHNKVLFDCINESLQQFRPHGKEGPPMIWSTAGRKLKPTEDFTLEEMFEITKHDLFRMAIVQAGTLPRREFVFNHHFDDELFAEIREKKLATLLCREIVETEPGWLKWDFEEAQTKIDIADMVLEALVTETIEFLNQKNPKSQAQVNFEEIQQMLKSRP